MTPTAPTTPDTGLTPDLIDRVTKLSPEDWERLVEIVDEAHGPPDTRTDEEIAAMIRERIADHDSGKTRSLTRQESDALIRAEMRKLGFELP